MAIFLLGAGVGLVVLSGCGPRPISTGTPTASTTPDPEVSQPLVTDGNSWLPLAAPVRLQIQDRSFNITAVEIQKSQWRYKSGQPDSGQWVYGTLVNYVIGLEATPENTALFQTLTEADSIRLLIANGRVLKFQFTGRQWVEQNAAPDVFQQVRPGLTLALLGDKGTQRLVVTAGYVAGVDPTPEAGNLVQVGTPVQVGEARVTVFSGQLVRQAADLPVGYAYYLVDFSVEGLGPNPLDASMFQMDLVDDQDKRYAVSIPASQAGKHGPAGGQLEPGQVLTATAGYLVPQTISSSKVVWVFSPRPGVQAPARFQLALVEPVPTPNPRSLVRVQVDSVGYSLDLSEILIAGGIGNPTDQIVTVDMADVVLESGGARMSLNGAEPAFPWNIAPGESRAFTLRFPRLAPGTAVLRILNWPFELSGLQ